MRLECQHRVLQNSWRSKSSTLGSSAATSAHPSSPHPSSAHPSSAHPSTSSIKRSSGPRSSGPPLAPLVPARARPGGAPPSRSQAEDLPQGGLACVRRVDPTCESHMWTPRGGRRVLKDADQASSLAIGCGSGKQPRHGMRIRQAASPWDVDQASSLAMGCGSGKQPRHGMWIRQAASP